LLAISARIGEGLRSGGWQLGGDGAWVRGDLQMTRRDYVRHPMDPVSLLLSADDSHRTLELTIRSHNDATGPVDRVMPWDVLRRGMRIKDRRENPIGVPDLKGLADYLPFHLEVGCGLSIEAGIPPLHFLHGVYQVTDREQGTFILDPARDHVITGLLASPESVMPRLTRMYRSCFLAEPSRAHWNLKTLANRGHLLEPVMTNNFDGLLARVGLAELYLRRYDQDMPAVDFDPRAKALLVIGSHADRRRVQQRARERGLKIFFLDPEGFWEGDAFTSYPLEGVRRGDFHCCQTASTAVQVLTDHLLKPEALG